MTTHLLSKRLPSVAAAVLLVAAALVAPSKGLAQSGDGDGDGDSSSSANSGKIAPRVISIAGANQDGFDEHWINLEHCDGKKDVVLEIDALPSDKDILDIYVGTGTDCTSTEARDGDGEAECRKLTMIDIAGMTGDVDLTIKVVDIIRAAYGDDACEARNSKPTLWFLAVDNSGGTDPVDTTEYGTLELSIDTTPPDPPTSVTGGRGENEIPVTWKTTGSKIDSFQIFVDSGTGMAPMRDGSVEPDPGNDEDGGTEVVVGETNDMCGSGRLRSGDRPENVESLFKKPEGSSTATSTTLSAREVGGEAAAVAVVALDAAKNRSALSEVTCVLVVPTRGIKDLYEEEHGEFPQGCPCSAAGPAQLEGALPIALALGLIAYRRRRRS